ncbi:MAG TPA: hypothetical protein VHT25_04860 [Solirubrobacteraceae bacterium]|jgi:hypothetical protein|nr:hypothetical protein [Solirubrobacteraceae bacterium]
MTRIISARRALTVALGVLLGAALSVALPTATASASKAKTWNVTKEAAIHQKENPRPDRYHNLEVWSWMYGEADTPSSYAVMENLFKPSVIKKECGVKGEHEWNRLPSLFTGLPAVLYYNGPTIERGQNECARSAEYPTKTFFMHPDNESSLASIVRWKSPITGTVTVSGSVQPTDSNVEGIVWQLDQGSTILLGPTEKADDSPTSFGPTTVSVSAGESLYLEIGPGLGGGSFDTTAVALNISA